MTHAERPTGMLLRQQAANRNAIRYRNPETGMRHYCHDPLYIRAFLRDVLAIRAELRRRAA